MSGGENDQQPNVEQYNITGQQVYPYSTLGRNCEFNAKLGNSTIQFEKATEGKFEIDLAVIQKALLWHLSLHLSLHLSPHHRLQWIQMQ